MATSGDIYTNYFSEEYGTVRLKYHWSRASYSVENNTSTISWTITTDGSMTSGWWYKAGPIVMTMTATNGSFTSGSSSYSNSSRIQLRGGGTQVAAGTAVLTHNATGVGSFSVSMSAAIYYTSTNVSGSGTASLETIPRATVPTFSSNPSNIGTALTITLNRASSSFTHTVKYSFGSLSNQQIGTGIGASTTWTPPVSLGNQIPNSTSGTCVITVDTYNGSTLIGTTNTNLTLTVPDTDAWRPTNTTSFTSTNSVGYLDVISAVKATVTGLSTAAKNGASVKTVSLTFQGKTYTSNITNETQIIITSENCSGVGSNTAVTRVTDSRGLYKESSRTITVLSYSLPTVNLALTRVSEAAGTNQNETGSYMRVTLSASVANVSGNSVSAKTLTYKIGNGSEQSVSISSLPYDSATGSANISVSNSSSCTVTATITDTAGGTTSVIQTLPVGFKTLDFLAGGKGINIGSTAVNENLAINRDVMLGGKVYRKNLLKDLGQCTGTDRSVSFSYTQDGGVFVNGTNDTTSTTAFKEYGTFMGIAGHKYVLSGGVGTSNYYVYVSGQSAVKDTTGNGVEFTFPSGVTTPWSVRVGVAGGKTASNVTFYPMIRDAGITDNTWEPYKPDPSDLPTSDNVWRGIQDFAGGLLLSNADPTLQIYHGENQRSLNNFRIRIGSIVKTLSNTSVRNAATGSIIIGGTTYNVDIFETLLFTWSELNTLFGVSSTGKANCIVLACNGDFEACNVRIIGTTNKSDGVYLSSAYRFQGVFTRINYIAIRYDV